MSEASLEACLASLLYWKMQCDRTKWFENIKKIVNIISDADTEYSREKVGDWRALIHSRHRRNCFYVTDGNIMYLTDASRFLISCVIQHYAPVVGWWGGGTDA